MAARDHPCNDIVAPETDGPLELQEDLCRGKHRRPLPADQGEDSRPQPPSDTAQRSASSTSRSALLYRCASSQLMFER